MIWIITSTLIFATQLSSINQIHNEQTSISYNTTDTFKINGLIVKPKDSLEFNSLAKSSNDTLDIIVCGEYVYSPFGQMKDKSDLKSSLLKNFSVKNKKEKIGGESYEIQQLTLGSNRLKLFFDHDPEASKESYILNGVISDSLVNFSNGIKIGMNQKDFYNAFFDVFPSELQNKFKVIILETCVDGLKHIYIMNNKKLLLMRFEEAN